MKTQQVRSVPATIGRAVLALCAVAALIATIGAVAGAIDAASASLDAWWRALALPVFAGLFGLLAVDPRRGLAFWLLLIANKLALTVVGAVNASSEAGMELLVFDGALTVLLVTAFTLTGGWRAPR